MQESPERNDIRTANNQPVKRPYEKPAFRQEAVFETRALACTKKSSCHTGKKC
jgi:hypothetical protein